MKTRQSATLIPRVRMLAAAALMTGAALPLAAQSPAIAPSGAGSAIVVQTKPSAMVSRIASAHRPAGASLDQMLLAILQANPDAFMAGNINLLKKGAALTMPAAAEVLATPAADARRMIQQQNADFEKHGYRLVQMASATVASTGASTPASPDGSATTAPAPNADAASGTQAPADTAASHQAAPIAAADSASAPSQAAPAAGTASAVAAEPAAASSAAGTASAVGPALPASDAASVTATAVTSSAPAEPASAPAATPPAPASDTGINPMVWLAAGGALLLTLVAWLMLRIRRMREEERLAAEAAAAQPRAAAEALSRVWDVDHQAGEPPSQAQDASPTTAAGTAAAATAAAIATPGAGTTGVAQATLKDQPEASTAEIDGLTLDLSALEEARNTDAPAIQPRTFDFSSIDLELEDPADTTASPEALQTRLELAREFLAISDYDGARALAEEVADKADEALEAQARQLLADIDAAEKQ